MDHAGFFRPAAQPGSAACPPPLTMLDETALLSRPWPLLVCSRGAESVSAAPPAPVPHGAAALRQPLRFPAARQTVDCGWTSAAA